MSEQTKKDYTSTKMRIAGNIAAGFVGNVQNWSLTEGGEARPGRIVFAACHMAELIVKHFEVK